MNKQLLTATALVAVGLLGASGAAVAQKKMKASKPTISVGGYYNAGVRFTDNADSVGGRNTGGFSSFTDSEIHFKIKGMLDNGIKIGGGWELEGDQTRCAGNGRGARLVPRCVRRGSARLGRRCRPVDGLGLSG